MVVDDPSTVGTLHLCKDYVAWSKLDADLLGSLLKARGRVSNSRTLDEESLKSLGYKDHSDLASKMIKDGSNALGHTGAEAVPRALTAARRFQAVLQAAVQGGRNPG